MEALLELPIIIFIWKLIGTGLGISGLVYLGGSALESIKNVRGSSLLAKVISILDEAALGVVLLGVVAIVFFTLSPNDMVEFVVKIVLWAWEGLLVPLLKYMGVPL